MALWMRRSASAERRFASRSFRRASSPSSMACRSSSHSFRRRGERKATDLHPTVGVDGEAVDLGADLLHGRGAGGLAAAGRDELGGAGDAGDEGLEAGGGGEEVADALPLLAVPLHLVAEEELLPPHPVQLLLPDRLQLVLLCGRG